ncbi:hypothetical protein FRC11_012750 [Ceratobasidium sp. 423]|nr:hypothetical protein FRC11_012750 [Ceratobasidium sp. 423]
MPEIMGGINSTDMPEESGGNGITAPMIVLACTLALYGLQLIQAGNSLQRVGTRKEKLVHFTKKKKEYLRIQVNNIEELDGNIEADDDMHSDGD